MDSAARTCPPPPDDRWTLCVGEKWEKLVKWEDFRSFFHSHVSNVLHLRLALEDGEGVDAPFWIHAGDPGAAAGARRARLSWHPWIWRPHRHPDNHYQAPAQAPPRPRACPRRGRSPARGSPGAHFRMPTSAIKARWNSLHGPAQVGWSARQGDGTRAQSKIRCCGGEKTISEQRNEGEGRKTQTRSSASR